MYYYAVFSSEKGHLPTPKWIPPACRDRSRSAFGTAPSACLGASGKNSARLATGAPNPLVNVTVNHGNMIHNVNL